MLSIYWAPRETDGLIYCGGVGRRGAGATRDQDLGEAPESSQEGPQILPGEGGVWGGFLEEGGPKLSVSIFNFYWFPKT